MNVELLVVDYPMKLPSLRSRLCTRSRRNDAKTIKGF